MAPSTAPSPAPTAPAAAPAAPAASVAFPTDTSDPAYNELVLAVLERKGFSKTAETYRLELSAAGKLTGATPGVGMPAATTAALPGGTKASTSTVAAGDAAAAPTAAPASASTNATVSLPTLMDRSAPIKPTGGIPPVFSPARQAVPGSSTAAGSTATLGAGGAKAGPIAGNEVKVLDPTERVIGYEGMKEWVESGLEAWRPELRHLLFPVFVHVFLDLISTNFPVAARDFFNTHSSSHTALHASPLSTLSAISTPAHLASSPLAIRFRAEKYVVRMSKGGFGLLVGWLSSGGIEGEWDAGNKRERGKEAVRGVVNERIKVEVADTTQPVSYLSLLSETGLLASHLPTSVDGEPLKPSPSAFNQSQGPLKLGIPLLGTKLADEVKRQVKLEDDKFAAAKKSEAAVESGATGVTDTDAMDVDPAAMPSSSTPVAATVALAAAGATPQPTSASGTPGPSSTGTAAVAPPPTTTTASSSSSAPLPAIDTPVSDPSLQMPTSEDLIPLPVNFRTYDVRREVERVLDTRKRIRLGPSSSTTPTKASFSGVSAASAAWKEDLSAGLPSVCAYTFHDAGEGVTSAAFSPDASLLAAGSEESCVRVWSLKGERLRGLKSDFDPANVKDAAALKKARDKAASPMRKLIGHSGPVYSLAFSPLAGSAAPPRHLLSSSQDGTVRLWSLDTWSSLLAYRGHQEPVWDVEWGPQGVYFATGSRDRTARLWSTDRIAALRLYAGHLGDVNCVKFHPNGLYLATGSTDRTCRLWDVQRGTCVRLFVGHHDNAVSSLAISPDGRYLASAAEDHAIALWDLGSSRLIKKLTSHTAPVQSLSFSAESSLLVSGGADCTVKVWDVKSAAVEPKQEMLAAAAGVAVGALSVASSMAAAGAVLPGGAAGATAAGLAAGAEGAPAGLVGVHAEGAKGALPMDLGNGAAAKAAAAKAATQGAAIPMLAFDGDLSGSLLTTFPTKRTPILNVQFTPRNLCLVAGVFNPFDAH